MSCNPLCKDFITAPEITQMFGEIIGLWCVNTWFKLGKLRFNLIEFGPGRGTLMRDMLSITKHIEGFHQSIDKIYMVELSPILTKQQQKLIADFNHIEFEWIHDISVVKSTQNIVICNEFFDALAIKQYVKYNDVVCEVHVVAKSEEFEFALKPSFINFEFDKDGVIEICLEAQHYAKDISRIVKNGAALIIDYGYLESPYKSTLQAVKDNKYHPILSDLGHADITAHVDFKALCEQFKSHDISINTQATFLKSYGIEARAQHLIKCGADKSTVDSALNRLVGDKEMGSLFKVLEVHGRN